MGTGLNAALVGLNLRLQRDATQQLQKDAGKAEAASMGALRQIEMVSSTATEADVWQRYAGYRTRVQAFSHRLGLRQTALGLLPGLLSQIIGLGVLVVGFLLVLGGQLTLGMLLAAQQVAAGLKAEIDRLIAFVSELPQIESAVLRLQDVLEHPPDPLLQRASGAWPPERRRLSGAIRIEELSYRFAPVRPPLIDGLTLAIDPGQRLALVGGSGSGKSTLARLLAGLLQPSAGQILYDGLPLAAVPRAVRLASIAMVQQEIALYGLTVRDNLCLWRPGLDDDQLWAACREAELAEVIAGLPDGLDTVLREGGTDLSGGQRQRLELARVLLGEPAILILDEATSALDAESERRINRALRRRACTQIVVAHRLSTVRDADLILVLEQGQVVQQGRHGPLLADTDGAYARLLAEEDPAVG